MITAVLLSLWAVFIIVVLITILWKGLGGNTFEFQNFHTTDIPYVTIDIQGNPLNMIVDTGCGMSILCTQAIADCELLYRNSDRKISLSAITSDKVNSDVITLDFKCGKKDITEDFCINDTPDFGNFYAMYGIRIHGLLGSPFFDKNNCKVDYKHHSLIIP